jgi:hypothetical protein
MISFLPMNRLRSAKHLEMPWFATMPTHTLEEMAKDFDLNIGNNIRMRDTQFMSMFWPKTLENWVKCILPCVHLGHTGGINLYFDTKHDLKDRKKRNNVFVRCFGTNN